MDTKLARLFSLLTILTAFYLLQFPAFSQQSQVGKYSSEALRQMLAHQPDYMGTEQFIFSEGFGGFGGRSKVAKLGNRLREEDKDQIIIHEPGKPSIRIIPGKRQYSEFTVDIPNQFAIDPEELAKRDDVTFKLVGTERVNGIKVLKVAAVYKNKKLEQIKMTFYIAPGLKNLIIKRETNLGGKVQMIMLLQDVSLSVSEKLFEIPSDYKKVEDPYKGIK